MPFLLQFYTACYIGNASVSVLSVELSDTVKCIMAENYWNTHWL